MLNRHSICHANSKKIHFSTLLFFWLRLLFILNFWNIYYIVYGIVFLCFSPDFFQRWKQAYFKIYPQQIYYAKSPNVRISSFSLFYLTFGYRSNNTSNVSRKVINCNALFLWKHVQENDFKHALYIHYFLFV